MATESKTRLVELGVKELKDLLIKVFGFESERPFSFQINYITVPNDQGPPDKKLDNIVIEQVIEVNTI